MSNVRNFGATGDGKTDDTAAIARAVTDGDGTLALPRGDYIINSPIIIDTTKTGRAAIHGTGGTAKVIMAGPGPAFIIKGNHTGTADPRSYKPLTWQNERLPMIENLEIEGRDAQADGIRIEGTTQATIQGLLVRNCRHAIRIAKRNRNVLITSCHLYHNTGVGVLIDQCNLHQINITGNHISYCRLGGVRIQKSEVRNLQITGNDIEYNNHKVHNTQPAPTAEIFIDCSDAKATVREGTIASNTIQATESEGGANIRMVGSAKNPLGSAGMWTIAGNLIGSQESNIDIEHCRAITVTGNIIYTAYRANIHAKQCENLVIANNTLDHNHVNSVKTPVHLRFEHCKGIALNGNIVHDHPKPVYKSSGHAKNGTIVFDQSQRITVTGCQITDARRAALHFDACDLVNITGCAVTQSQGDPTLTTSVCFTGKGKNLAITGNLLTKGTNGPVQIAEDVVVAQANNTIVE